MTNQIPLIVGPTSTGKTGLALELAHALKGVIISADSRQLFKYMDIGTGKIPVGATHTLIKHLDYWEIDGVPVYGYDLASPGEYFSAYDWAKFAINKITELLAQKVTPIVVGGTGFYIDLLTGRKAPSQVKPDFELRKELSKKTISELVAELHRLNPKKAETVDTKNSARVLRALEIELNQENKQEPLPKLKDTNFQLYGLRYENPEMFANADTWVDKIWEQGLVEETQKLLAKGYSDTLQMNGLVYSTTKEFLAGKLPQAQAVQRIKFDLHSYIRRQMTWFKKNPEIVWLDTKSLSRAQIIKTITNKLG